MADKRKEAARALLLNPVELGHRLGYADLKQELHGEWMLRMLTAQEDMTLQAHRGSYKTTCLTIVIAEMLLLHRGENIIFLRKTDNDVAEVIAQVQRILETPLMQQIYYSLTGRPLTLMKATKSEITTSAYQAPRGAAQLLGIGIGGSLTGKHADMIFTDDIVNVKDRISRAEREQTKLIYQELQNIRNRGGRIINTGTPWHKEDAFSLMPNVQRFDCYTTGLIAPDKLEGLRQSMSPSLFAANYELKHIADENALFTAPITGADAAKAEQGIAHIDAAYGGGDGTALTICKRHGDDFFVYGRLWQKHIDDCLDECLALADRFMVGKVYVEDNGDKGYLAKEIRARGARVQKYHEGMNKFIKISSYLRPVWSHVHFVEGTDADYVNQVCDFTENAEHDDAPDSLACAVRILYKRGNEQAYVSPFERG